MGWLQSLETPQATAFCPLMGPSCGYCWHCVWGHLQSLQPPHIPFPHDKDLTNTFMNEQSLANFPISSLSFLVYLPTQLPFEASSAVTPASYVALDKQLNSTQCLLLGCNGGILFGNRED